MKPCQEVSIVKPFYNRLSNIYDSLSSIRGVSYLYWKAEDTNIYEASVNFKPVHSPVDYMYISRNSKGTIVLLITKKKVTSIEEGIDAYVRIVVEKEKDDSVYSIVFDRLEDIEIEGKDIDDAIKQVESFIDSYNQREDVFYSTCITDLLGEHRLEIINYD